MINYLLRAFKTNEKGFIYLFTALLKTKLVRFVNSALYVLNYKRLLPRKVVSLLLKKTRADSTCHGSWFRNIRQIALLQNCLSWNYISYHAIVETDMHLIETHFDLTRKKNEEMRKQNLIVIDHSTNIKSLFVELTFLFYYRLPGHLKAHNYIKS